MGKGKVMNCAWCGEEVTKKKRFESTSGEVTHLGDCEKEFKNSRGVGIGGIEVTETEDKEEN